MKNLQPREERPGLVASLPASTSEPAVAWRAEPLIHTASPSNTVFGDRPQLRDP